MENEKDDDLETKSKRYRLNTLLKRVALNDELDGINNEITDNTLLEQKNFVVCQLSFELQDIPSYIIEDDDFISVMALLSYDNDNFNWNNLDTENILKRYEAFKKSDKSHDTNDNDLSDSDEATDEKDENGFYVLNDDMIDKVIQDNDFYINDNKTYNDLEKEIYNTWENQKEKLTQDTLNNDSEKRNGLPFKYFYFCEKYLEKGKIKPTCEMLGISRNTAYLWLKEKKVQEYLKSRQEEIKKDYDNTFKSIYYSCFDNIKDLINDEYIPTSDRIRAINTFLNHYENMEKIKNDL